ncbi:MAG: TetR/AcrR family transcriptional regulator, partial [Pseudomonadota bacterium]
MSAKRDQIEAVATRAIKGSGLGSVSFRTLADEVGVKSSSVHYHFRTKDDLAEAVIRRYSTDFEAILARIDSEHATPIERLDAFIDVYEAAVQNGDICLCGMMAAELTSLDDAGQRALRGYFRLNEQWLEKLFATSETSLQGVTPAELAQLFIAGLQGATLIDRAEG